jgi:serine protease inhibitor
MFKIIKYIFVLLIFIGLFQCTNNPFTPNIRELTPAEKGLVEADNSFGLKLFKEVVFEEETNINICISPLSVSMALGMTYNGADGSTEEAMRTTLDLSDLTLEEINESYKSLIEYLVGLDQEVEFDIANSIWYHERFTENIKEDFLDRCNTYFDAEISSLDFSNPNASKETMNNWVDENTNGKIDKIVEHIYPGYDLMFLLNAIYFNGTWVYEFNKDETKDTLFYLPDGSEINCMMMEVRGYFLYFKNSAFQLIDLPYGDGNYSMTILLPKAGKDIDSLIAELTPEKWTEWINNLSGDSLDLYFPKFTLEYKIKEKLKEVLKELGMGIAFDQQKADFSKMVEGMQVFIDRVIHKTFLEVDEEGTEAAAATCVVISREIATGLIMHVNRPFLFVIREKNSGIILFIGKIVNPTL